MKASDGSASTYKSVCADLHDPSRPSQIQIGGISSVSAGSHHHRSTAIGQGSSRWDNQGPPRNDSSAVAVDPIHRQGVCLFFFQNSCTVGAKYPIRDHHRPNRRDRVGIGCATRDIDFPFESDRQVCALVGECFSRCGGSEIAGCIREDQSDVRTTAVAEVHVLTQILVKSVVSSSREL